MKVDQGLEDFYCRDDMYSCQGSGMATWRCEENEALIKRINVLEKTLCSVMDENRSFSQLHAAHTTKLASHTTSITEFEQRYGTGEADNTVVVRQKHNEIHRKDWKDLALKDVDIVKVNTT